MSSRPNADVESAWFDCPSTSTRSRRCATRAAARVPRVLEAVDVCLDAGAPGITVHPRADRAPHHAATTCATIAARAARRARRASSSTSKAIRGRTCSSWSREVRPDQCTLVPVAPGEVTSQAGWPAGTPADRAAGDRRATCRRRGVRVSLFVDPTPERDPLGGVDSAPIASSSTPSRSRAPSRQGADAGRRSFAAYAEAAELAHALGLGVNAGHDLDLDNLVAVPDAAASRRGVDRPRHHVARAVRRPRHRRPRVPGAASRARAALRYDRTRPPPMKSDAIAFGIAGVLFGLIAGWIIGAQQAAVRPPRGRAAAAQQPRRRRAAAPRRAPRSSTRRRSTRSRRSPSASRPTPTPRVAARQPLLRRRALRRRDQVVRRGAEARAEGRQRQHRSRRLLLLHRTSRTRRSRSSTSRSSSIRSTPRRC